MTIKELDQRLTLVLEDFSSEMRSEYDDYSNEPVTGVDFLCPEAGNQIRL